MSTHSAIPTASPAAYAPTITPSDAARLAQAGEATIIDVREADEHRRQHVPNTLLRPSSSFRAASFPQSQPNQQLLILCRSGGRASQVATELRNAGRSNVSVIDGGIIAWERTGLPTVTDSKAPLPIMRQVMVTVGVLLIACSTLAATVSPWFFVGTGFIGAGLLTAGATGMCMLSTILMKMPWNRATNGASAANSCSR
jgi:rhodanese-related sulfurtransferase